ncbi:hypothetical protein [Gordonia alkanivorans]|uniref:hypothetical protein n=1 Tax=Gordonia alkanivorans TaxID=84096 RepID=UPI001E33180A|nr:hypothetical protein [Gordonia alkanivorans]MDH3009900.1 hypothetical protein [Gordonia alkanivorans]
MHTVRSSLVLKGHGFLTGVLCTLLTLCVACGPSPNTGGDSTSSSQPSVADRLPPRLQTSYRWFETDVLDLASSEGTFVRAYTESFELSFEGQSPQWGYPGFVEASPSDIDEKVTFVPSESSHNDVVSTLFFRPLRRVDDGPNVRIVLCRSEIFSIAPSARGGSQEWRNVHAQWGFPVTIDLTKSGDVLPPADQAGPAPAPGRSVFGSWKVTDFDRLGVRPENSADIVACDALPDNPDIPRIDMYSGPDPVPTLPSYPGWPANGV